MQRRSRARNFARPPLRSAVPRDWWPGRANGKKKLRADFCAPFFEETFPPGLVVSKRQWKEERARGLLRALL